jgi:hypothetical protein
VLAVDLEYLRGLPELRSVRDGEAKFALDHPFALVPHLRRIRLFFFEKVKY